MLSIASAQQPLWLGQQYLALAPRLCAVGTVSAPRHGGRDDDALRVPAGVRHVAVIVSAPREGENVVALVEWTARSGQPAATFDTHTVLLSHPNNENGGLEQIVSVCLVPHGSGELTILFGMSDGALRVVARHAVPTAVEERDAASANGYDDHVAQPVEYRFQDSVRYLPSAPCAMCPLRGVDGGAVVACGHRSGRMSLVSVVHHAVGFLRELVSPAAPLLRVFPLTQLTKARQGSTSPGEPLYGLCNTTIFRFHLREETGVLDVAAAFEWWPRDPIRCFTIRDQFLWAGTNDGLVVRWECGGDGAAGQRETQGAAAANVVEDVNARTSDGAMPPSVVCLATRNAQELYVGTSLGTVSQYASGGATTPVVLYPRGAEDSVNDERRAALFGSPALVAMMSSDQCLVTVDESGMVNVWAWQ